MAQVLILSSFVARGAVGGGLTQFVLQRLGHDATLLPTILLSNHPGPKPFAGEATSPELIDSMMKAYATNGLLDRYDAVFCGYMPGIGHVDVAARWITKLKQENPRLTILMDPIMGDCSSLGDHTGDRPGRLYIAQDVATAMAKRLAPLADIITPNLFEFCYLAAAGNPAGSETRCDGSIKDDQFREMAARLSAQTVLVTSALEDDDSITSLLMTAGNLRKIVAPRRTAAPHGTGDLTAALYLGYILNGMNGEQTFGRAINNVHSVIEASKGHALLQITQTQSIWAGGS